MNICLREDSLCPLCGALEYWDHILRQCSEYAFARNSLFSTLPAAGRPHASLSPVLSGRKSWCRAHNISAPNFSSHDWLEWLPVGRTHPFLRLFLFSFVFVFCFVRREPSPFAFLVFILSFFSIFSTIVRCDDTIRTSYLPLVSGSSCTRLSLPLPFIYFFAVLGLNCMTHFFIRHILFLALSAIVTSLHCSYLWPAPFFVSFLLESVFISSYIYYCFRICFLRIPFSLVIYLFNL